MPSQNPIPLSSLLDPNYTFEQLAAAHNTTLEAITLWMMTPEVQERLATIEAASIQRTRIIAHRYLPAVATACHNIVQRFHNPEVLAQIDPHDHAAMDHERRNAQTARQAGRLLLQLARFRKVLNAAPVTATPNESAGAASAASTTSSPPRDKNLSTQSSVPAPSPTPDIFALLQTPEFQSALATALNSPPAPPLVEPKNPPARTTNPTRTAPSPPSNLEPEISDPSPSAPSSSSDSSVPSVPSASPSDSSEARFSERNTLGPGGRDRETRENTPDSPKPTQRPTRMYDSGDRAALSSTLSTRHSALSTSHGAHLAKPPHLTPFPAVAETPGIIPRAP